MWEPRVRIIHYGGNCCCRLLSDWGYGRCWMCSVDYCMFLSGFKWITSGHITVYLGGTGQDQSVSVFSVKLSRVPFGKISVSQHTWENKAQLMGINDIKTQTIALIKRRKLFWIKTMFNLITIVKKKRWCQHVSLRSETPILAPLSARSLRLSVRMHTHHSSSTAWMCSM